MSTKVVTGLVRFGFAHVFKPYAYKPGDKEQYSVQVMVPKSDKKTIKKINEAVNATIEQGIQTKWNGTKPANLTLPLHDGDETDRPELEGMYYLNLKADASHAPGVFDQDGEDILDPAELKSGDWGRAVFTLYPFNNKMKGVACGLVSVKKIKDGEPLGGSVASASDYDEDDDDDYGIDA